MRSRSALSFLLIFLTAACVDRVFFDVGSNALSIVVVDGQITNQPGPYKIVIQTAQDLESKTNQHPISVKQLTLSDNAGTSEILSEINPGTYKTDSLGIQGTVGRVYKIKIELFDCRVYESKPDTLFLPGTVDSIYFNFKKETTEEFQPLNGSEKYSLDVLFNSSAGAKSNFHFLWNFTGTFQAETEPSGNNGCNFDYEGGRCNWTPLCTGLRDVSNYLDPLRVEYIRVAPCSCCTCWYNLYNPIPIVSDNQLARNGRFNTIKAYNVPINGWTFSHKVYIEVNQTSLSQQAYYFWRSVKGQKEAINSLFQPVTGKIPSNFVQLSGTSASISGLFFASATSKKSKFITREDVPNQNIIPPRSEFGWPDICQTLFPNATNSKPSYWKD